MVVLRNEFVLALTLRWHLCFVLALMLRPRSGSDGEEQGNRGMRAAHGRAESVLMPVAVRYASARVEQIWVPG